MSTHAPRPPVPQATTPGRTDAPPPEQVPGRARFRPARGLGNPHVQTILGKFLRPDAEMPLRRERVETPDGDFVDLDTPVEAPGEEHSTPTVLVLHGLEGSASRRYMKTMYRALLDRGIRPIGLNFRGCSGEPNRTVRAYHSGETEDLRHVVRLVSLRFPGPLGLVGFSLGGNVVLKFLGEAGSRTTPTIDAAAAVSVPFDLAAGSDRIAEGLMGRVYTRYFMRSLLGKIEAKADLLREACDLDAIRRARTLREFDELATSRLHGFEGAADYYDRSSSARFIEAIRVPTLIVHAQDDPFLPPERIPTAAFDTNPAVTAVLPERGGHVGFIEGSVLRPTFWAERVVAEYLAERLGTLRKRAEGGTRSSGAALDRPAATG